MVSVYSQFMQNFGQVTNLVLVAPLAGQFYLLIHSFLIGLIISVIMYGNYKNGIKFSVPILCVSYGIFYFISNFASDGIDSTHGAILACECEIDLRSNKKLI